VLGAALQARVHSGFKDLGRITSAICILQHVLHAAWTVCAAHMPSSHCHGPLSLLGCGTTAQMLQSATLRVCFNTATIITPHAVANSWPEANS
jgi:hypothetical protein